MQSVQHMVRTGRRGPMHEFSMAFADLRASTQRIGLAWSLAWHDIVSRYRGSMLGPFWITLSMGLMVAGIGFLYANLFKVPVNEFIPYVALGIVFWGLMSNVIIEGCGTRGSFISIRRGARCSGSCGRGPRATPSLAGMPP